MIDDAFVDLSSPTSITKSTSQSSCSRISSGVDSISSSDRLALVVVIGKMLANLQAISLSGTLTPTLLNPPVTDLGTIFLFF